jgi:hypothetical protein
LMALHYKITEIINGIARVEYGDGSWAQIALRADMTPEELDELVYQFGPKPAAAPAFIEAGLQRLAQPAPKAPVPEPEVFDGEAQIAGLDPELQARLERNQRLAATDSFALTDRIMPPEIAAYRQALRDLPQSDDWAPRLVWDALKGVVVLGVGWPEVG